MPRAQPSPPPGGRSAGPLQTASDTISSPSHDGEPDATRTVGPDDLDGLLACLVGLATRPPERFHVRMPSLRPPDPVRLAEGIDRVAGRIPEPWARALRDGWPADVEGLHRIELASGTGLVDIACRLPPDQWRRLPAGFRSRPAAVGAGTSPIAAADALIVGAGLAGCALADALTRRGWRVTVLEADAGPGGAVRGLPLLAQHPAISPGRDRRSRLLVRALLVGARLGVRLGAAFERCGRFQPMPYDEALRRCEGLPHELVQPVRGDRAQTVAGDAVPPVDGLWFPACAVADPGQWWRQVLERPGAVLRTATPVASLDHDAAAWQARDDNGQPIASAPVAILANQAGAFALSGMTCASTGRLRHSELQVMVGFPAPGRMVPAGAGPIPIIGGPGFRIERRGTARVHGPASDGTFELTGSDRRDWTWHRSDRAHRLQLRDNLPMIGAVPDESLILADQDRYERNDRLALPRRPRLQIVAGLGGRGLLWAVLGAEIIAADLNGEPAFLEPDLAAAVDPARFLKRSLQRARRGRGAPG